MFLYVPAGWVNNRVRVRTIILCGMVWRLFTYLILFVLIPPFRVMEAIAISWAVVDAIIWPAVANGVCILSADQDRKGKGMAMGMLEAVRRLAEFGLNGIVIVALVLFPESATTTVMRTFAIIYALLLMPMMLAVARYVPDTRIATEEHVSHSVAALKGLLHVLALPRIWLAGVAAMAVYWCDINLMYISAPFLKQVFNASTTVATSTAPDLRSRRRSGPHPQETTDFALFISWITSSSSQARLHHGDDRAFRRRTSWCWQAPAPAPNPAARDLD